MWDVGAAEGLVRDFRLHRAAVVVNDVVRPQQHFDAAVAPATDAALAAFQRQCRMECAEFDLDLMRAEHLTREEYALAYKISDKAVGWLVVEPVRGVPLLDPPSCMTPISSAMAKASFWS